MPVFGRIVTRVLNDYIRRINETPKQIVRDVFTRVINRTPIDYERKDPETVGRARANWIATEGTFNKDTIEVNDEYGGQAPVLFSRGPTVRNMERFVDELNVDDNPRIYLTNNISYITRLEYLRISRQAPYGMRGITIAEFPMLVDIRARAEFSKRLT